MSQTSPEASVAISFARRVRAFIELTPLIKLNVLIKLPKVSARKPSAISLVRHTTNVYTAIAHKDAMAMAGFHLEMFTPGEAERITGCAVPAQGTYRARGFLPSHGGKNARFDLFDLSLVLFIRSMNERDLGFIAARTLGPWVVDAIVRRVLRLEDAFDPLLLDEDAHLDELAAEVLREHSPSGPERSALDAGRFTVIWADGSPGFHHTVDAELFEAEGEQHPRRVVGPITVFDTLMAASELLARAGRPFVRHPASASVGAMPRRAMAS